MEFDKKEIERIIARETRYIERRQADIVDIQYDIKATRKTIAFWKNELKKVSKGKEG